MSIVIRGMEMPKDCWECAVQVNPVCIEFVDFGTRGERPAGCPLVEVPASHGRLIDADALNVYDISPVYGFSVMGVTEEDIIQASAIIPAEEGE